MNLKTTLIQNWNDNDQQNLYKYILSNVQEFSKHIKDVVIVGSRIGGWAIEKSDMDVIVFVDDDIPCTKPKLMYFNDIGICIYTRHGDIYTDKKVYGRFDLPRYSLKTKEYIKVNDKSINDYLNWKFKTKRIYR